MKQEDIVSGYEFAKGRYVVFDPAELDALRSRSDQMLRIDAFFPAGTLDPVYADAKSYYLVPDGHVAQQAYAVLVQAMRDKKRQALAQVLLHRKEHLVWLRPVDNLIVMTTLYYDNQITKLQTFAAEAPSRQLPAEELSLMHTLVDACTPSQFDYARYHDPYASKLTQLLDAKVSGQAVVSPPAEEVAALSSLLEALKRSVAETTPAVSGATDNGTSRKKVGHSNGKAVNGRAKKQRSK